jgi:hypothetical protein
VIDGPNYIAVYSYPIFVLLYPRDGTPLSAGWLVPLLILGIAMCRTRIPSSQQRAGTS